MVFKVGTYLGGVNSLETLKARCHVDEDTGCWCWRQHRTKHGLALVRLSTPTGSTSALGRRAALMLAGKVPPSEHHAAYAIETCYELGCVNPKHARWGTRKERMRQSAARGAMSDPERIARLMRCSQERSKLTPEQRIEVATSTESIKDLAARFGVSAGRVAQIRRGDDKRLASSVFNWRP